MRNDHLLEVILDFKNRRRDSTFLPSDSRMVPSQHGRTKGHASAGGEDKNWSSRREKRSFDLGG